MTSVIPKTSTSTMRNTGSSETRAGAGAEAVVMEAPLSRKRPSESPAQADRRPQQPGARTVRGDTVQANVGHEHQVICHRDPRLHSYDGTNAIGRCFRWKRNVDRQREPAEIERLRFGDARECDPPRDHTIQRPVEH